MENADNKEESEIFHTPEDISQEFQKLQIILLKYEEGIVELEESYEKIIKRF